MENKKTIKDLMNAEQISDGDYLALNQPNVFSLVTQGNGDTRKITVGQLVEHVNKCNRVVGIGIIAFREISPYEQLKKRWLPLKYEIIEIAAYQELCDLQWVGPDANATAPFWYRCDADGTRNVNGQYMRVADNRGLFWRVAGQNAVFMAANDTPYDGKALGSANKDTLGVHGHKICDTNNPGWQLGTDRFETASGGGLKWITNAKGLAGSYLLANHIIPDTDYNEVRYSHETAGAWLAVSAYISY